MRTVKGFKMTSDAEYRKANLIDALGDKKVLDWFINNLYDTAEGTGDYDLAYSNMEETIPEAIRRMEKECAQP